MVRIVKDPIEDSETESEEETAGQPWNSEDYIEHIIEQLDPESDTDRSILRVHLGLVSGEALEIISDLLDAILEDDDDEDDEK